MLSVRFACRNSNTIFGKCNWWEWDGSSAPWDSFVRATDVCRLGTSEPRNDGERNVSIAIFHTKKKEEEEKCNALQITCGGETGWHRVNGKCMQCNELLPELQKVKHDLQMSFEDIFAQPPKLYEKNSEKYEDGYFIKFSVTWLERVEIIELWICFVDLLIFLLFVWWWYISKLKYLLFG